MTPAFSVGPDRPSARRVALRLLVVLAVVIAAAAIVLVVLATTPWGNERVRRVVVSQANQRLTGQLAIGRLRGNLFSGATLTDVRVTDSAAHPVFSARRMVSAFQSFTSSTSRPRRGWPPPPSGWRCFRPTGTSYHSR